MRARDGTTVARVQIMMVVESMDPGGTMEGIDIDGSVTQIQEATTWIWGLCGLLLDVSLLGLDMD